MIPNDREVLQRDGRHGRRRGGTDETNGALGEVRNDNQVLDRRDGIVRPVINVAVGDRKLS